VARETSAGVLAYRWRQGAPEFLLVHPGGPYWAARDEAGWSIPKGLVAPGEETWSAAAREFEEELGQPITGDPHPLSPCRTPGGKLILSWLVEADLDLSASRSNLFEMEWPPRSGNLRRYPEVDRAEYFIFETALWKAHRGQRPILLEAVTRLTAA
jgi:predicted NUDIX family NTP pyrophosphohydrolase